MPLSRRPTFKLGRWGGKDVWCPYRAMERFISASVHGVGCSSSNSSCNNLAMVCRWGKKLKHPIYNGFMKYIINLMKFPSNIVKFLFSHTKFDIYILLIEDR